MTTIYVKTVDQILSGVILPKLATGNKNTVRLHVDFDTAWDGYSGRSAIFYTDKNLTPYKKPLFSDGNCDVPPECLVEDAHLFVAVEGVSASGAVKSSTRMQFKIVPGSPVIVMSDPTADVYHQLLGMYGNTETALAVERARINNIISGAAAGDTEVTDIRVDVDGKTHATAGEAVRAQVQSLTADIGTFQTVFNPDLEVGTLSEGVIEYSTTRAVMLDKLRAYRTIAKCGTDSNYMYGYAVYDSDGNYDGVDHGWNAFNGGAVVFTDCYFRMNFRRVDNANLTDDDISALKSLVTISEFTAKNDIEELKKSVYEGEAIPASFELELGSISAGENAAFTARARFANYVPVTPKTVVRVEPNYNYLYGYTFYDEGGVYDGVDHDWLNPVHFPTVTFAKNGYVRLNFRRTDEGEITQSDFTEIAELLTITDRKNNADILKEVEKSNAINSAIGSINIEYGRTNGASYVFARIPKMTNNGKSITPRIQLTSADGSISGEKVPALTFAKRNGSVFTLNAGLFNTSTLQPVGQTIIDGVSVTNTPMTDDMGTAISDAECYPLCIDGNGDLSAPYTRNIDTADMIAAGVVHAVTGWGKVVENFAACPDTVENEIVHAGKYIRQVIGQFQNGDYLVCTVDMSRGAIQNEAGITYSELADFLIGKGVKFAYSLDGGGSAETVIGCRHLNPIYEGTDGRSVPTVLAFYCE